MKGTQETAGVILERISGIQENLQRVEQERMEEEKMEEERIRQERIEQERLKMRQVLYQ